MAHVVAFFNESRQEIKKVAVAGDLDIAEHFAILVKFGLNEHDLRVTSEISFDPTQPGARWLSARDEVKAIIKILRPPGNQT